jgi:hypothetical protein
MRGAPKPFRPRTPFTEVYMAGFENPLPSRGRRGLTRDRKISISSGATAHNPAGGDTPAAPAAHRLLPI